MLSPLAAEPALSRLALLSRSRFSRGSRAALALPDSLEGSRLASRRSESTGDPERPTTSRSSSSTSKEAKPPQNNSHWLDSRAPKAAAWLEAKSRELWLRGLDERCKQFPLELGGHEAFLRRVVVERAESLVRRRHGDGESETTTSREKTHLQTAALVRATGDALLPFFRGDERRVEEILVDSAGGRVSGALRSALRLQAKLVSALSRLFPSRSTEIGGVAERRLELLRSDYGGAWPGAEVSVEAGGGGGERPRTTTTTLRVPSCLYHETMTEGSDAGGEGPPRWLAACCCSVDSVWFEPWKRPGDGEETDGATTPTFDCPLPSVSFRRRRWLGAGDDACELCVTRVEAA